jgi:hypothetical protein
MTPEEFETFRTVHGHNNFRVYKAFEEGDGGDRYVTVNDAIAFAIREAYEDAARIAEGTDWHMDRPHTPVEILIASQIAKAIRARIT